MIKKLTLDDKDQLIQLIQSLNMFQEDEISFIIEGFQNRDDECIWLGDQEEKELVAVVHSVPEAMTNGTWNALMLIVSPEYQKQGRGKALMRQLENELMSRDQRLLIVETSAMDDFQGARDFYAKIDYTCEAMIKHFYDANDHKIVFSRLLTK